MRCQDQQYVCASRVGRRPGVLVLAAGAAVALGMIPSRASAQYVWNAAATGNFSAASNWQGPLPPWATGSASGNAVNGSGTTSLAFNFTSPVNSGVIATYDTTVASTLMLNNLTFDLRTVNSAPLTLRGSTSMNSMIQMAGVSPTITLNGTHGGTVAVTNTGTTSLGLQLAADTVINGTGTGYFSFNAITTELGGPRSLTISGAPLNQYARTVFLNNTQSFTGGLNLDGGNLQIATGGALGPAGSTFRVTPNGGVLTASSAVTATTVSNIQLDGQLKFVSVNTVNFGPTNVMAGSGSLLINVASSSGSSGLFVQSASTNSGDVTIDRFDMPNNTGGLGGLGLQGTVGSMLNVGTFNVRGGGVLWENNSYSANTALTTADKNSNSNRIGDHATLNLGSSSFRVSGSGSLTTTQADVNETVGTVNGSGMPIIWAEQSSGTTKATTITVGDALNRSDRGTFVFRGATLGGDGTTTGAAGVSYINVPTAVNATMVGGGGASGSTTMSILPYAVAETYVSASTTRYAPSFATIGPSGVRGLAVAEYATSLTASAQANVLLTAPATNTNSDADGLGTTINSLLLGSAGHGLTDGSVSGGTLRVTSGAILAAGDTVSGPTISSTLAFGGTEAKIYTTGGGHLGATGFSPSSSSNELTISGNMIGTGGLTKFGAAVNNNSGNAGNTLYLTGDNTGLSGPLTLNSGFVDFATPNSLPGSGQIVANGSSAPTSGTVNPSGTPTGLTFSGSNQSMTLMRDVAVNSGWMSFRAGDLASSNSTFRVAGVISGQGAVNLYGNTSLGHEVWIDGTSNTYTGPTQILAGNVHIAGDGSLGSGGAVGMNGGTLVLENDWTTSRMVNFTSNSTINTNGHNAVLNGMITGYASTNTGTTANGTGQITKTGAGTLTITGNTNTQTGTITVSGGSVLVNGSIAPSASPVNVAASALLGGSGTIYRPIAIAAGGILSPGAGPGVLTEWGNLALSSGSIFAIDINGAAVGTDYDRMAVNGTVTLTGSTLAPSLGYVPSFFDVFFVLTNDGTDAITGTFNGLAEGSTVTLGLTNGGTTPVTATISYLGDAATGSLTGGNDVVLYNIVPAPGTAALFGLGSLFAARRRRP